MCMCTGMGAGATAWCFAGSPLNIWKFYAQRLRANVRTSKHFWMSGRISYFFCAFRYASERSVPMASDHCQSRFPEPFFQRLMGRDPFLCRQQKRKLDLELDPFLTPRPGDLIQKKLLLLLPWVPKGCRIIRVAWICSFFHLKRRRRLFL